MRAWLAVFVGAACLAPASSWELSDEEANIQSLVFESFEESDDDDQDNCGKTFSVGVNDYTAECTALSDCPRPKTVVYNLCGGGSDVCCVDTKKNDCEGSCKMTPAKCGGGKQFVPGKCPGPAEVKCCTASSSSTAVEPARKPKTTECKSSHFGGTAASCMSTFYGNCGGRDQTQVWNLGCEDAGMKLLVKDFDGVCCVEKGSTCQGTCKRPTGSIGVGDVCAEGTNRKYEKGGCPGRGILCCPHKEAEVPPAKEPSDEGLSTEGPAQTKITTTYKKKRKANVELMIRTAVQQGVNNPKSIVGMLCVLGKETHFRLKKAENMNYSKERLAEVWSRFSTYKNKEGKQSPAPRCKEKDKSKCPKYYNTLAEEYEHKAEALGNLVYCCKYGNGEPETGDGYKYRGRGFNQITWKGTYEKYSKLMGLDLVGEPDLLNQPEVAAKAAVMFLLNRFGEKNIDPNDFDSVDAALQKWAAANAGWGKSPKSAIKNSRKEVSKFEVVDETYFE